MISLGLGRDIFQAVTVVVLSTACGKLVDWGVEEVKERRKRTNEAKKAKEERLERLAR